MVGANILSTEQQLLVEKISQPNTNLSREQATVSIYLYFNRLAKPVSELKSIITAVDPTLLSKDKVDKCLQWMKTRSLIQETYDSRVEMRYIEITAEFERIMETLTGINGLAAELMRVYSSISQKVCVIPKGIVGAIKENYTEMLEIIQHAQNRVNYAVLNTEPYEDTVRVLKKAAQKGVQVRILVASEKVAQSYKKKKSVEHLWKHEFENCPNVHIRVFEDVSVTELCSSVQVDGILRFDIYDPKRIRSLDGYLLEMRNNWNENINLFHWYTEKFDKAWDSAYSSQWDRTAKKIFTPFLGSIVIVLFCVYIYFSYRMDDSAVAQSFVDEILLLIIGASGEYLLRTSWHKIKAMVAAVWRALKEKS